MLNHWGRMVYKFALLAHRRAPPVLRMKWPHVRSYFQPKVFTETNRHSAFISENLEHRIKQEQRKLVGMYLHSLRAEQRSMDHNDFDVRA